MHKRDLCCHAVSVCLSACLSITFVDHVKTNKHIFEIFSPSGASNAGGGGKKRDSGRIFGFAAYRSSVVNRTSREV